nr:hypothetical protein [Clostridium sp.]
MEVKPEKKTGSCTSLDHSVLPRKRGERRLRKRLAKRFWMQLTTLVHL